MYNEYPYHRGRYSVLLSLKHINMVNKNMVKKKTLSSLLLMALLFSAWPYYSQAQTITGTFNPGNIISDREILDNNTMSEREIQAFLESKKSFLATYKVIDDQGNEILTSRAIYDRALTNRLSAEFIIVMLQKEMGLIELTAIPDNRRRVDYGMGYGCPDSGGCNPRWEGLWKQINSATLQFRDYMDNPGRYRFQVGQTYTFNNQFSTLQQGPLNVTIENRATASLYNYTPHVYNGNYNFWRIWQRYFTKSYLNGSLLQASGEAGVWLIQDGLKRPFLSRSALTSRFDINHIQIVSRGDLDKYPTGAPIKFSQYSVVRIPTGRIYLLVNDTKRHFVDMEAFRKVGIHPDEVIAVTPEEIASYKDGVSITANDAYPAGAILQNKHTGGMYWIDGQTKAPLLDKVLLSTNFKNQRYIQVDQTILDTFTTVEPVRLMDGELVKTIDNPVVYVLEDGLKRPISSEAVFLRLGYKWPNISIVSDRLLNLHEEGELVISQ